MSSTATKELSIAQLAIVPFKWAWDFNHCVPLMLQFLLQLHRQNMHMFNLKLIKPSSLLDAFSTFVSRFMVSWINSILSTNNIMTYIRCHRSFKWVTRFNCICKMNSLQNPIGIFDHSDMGLTPSPILWVTMLSS